MQTPKFRRHALLPKPLLSEREASDHHESIATGLGALAPAERRALAAIVEAADLIEASPESETQFLLVEVTPEVVETLSQFGAELEELEPPEDDEDLDQDDNSADDNAFELTQFNDVFGRRLPDVGDVEWEEGAPLKGARKTRAAFLREYRERNGTDPHRERPAAAVVKALLRLLPKPARRRWRDGLTGRADGPIIQARGG